MITLTEEQAQQIEVTIALSLGYFPETVDGGVAMERAKKSIATFRAARAQEQADQEPVAWMHEIDRDQDGRCSFTVYYNQTPGYCIPLYTAPQPVSQEPVANPVANYAETSDSPIPAAWLYEYKPAGTRFVTLEMVSAINHQQVRETPLYVHPMGRQWVGLTDEEIDEIPFNRVSDDPLLEYARAVIAAYKAKQP